MAEGKNRIFVYRDWLPTFEALSDDEAGKLIKHFFRYINDLNPEAPDRLTHLLFEPIKQTLKRDLRKYEATCLRNKDNGQKGGRPKQNPDKPSGLFKNPKKPDRDRDRDRDKDINKEKSIKSMANKSPDFIDDILKSFVEIHGNYKIVNRGKERAAAGKLLQIYKEKYPNATTSETLAGLKVYFEQCVNINDAWLKTNMSLPIIIDKFNQINTIIRNGGIKKNSGATEAELIQLIASKHGVDSPERKY